MTPLHQEIRLINRGIAVALLGLIGFASVWAATAPLSGAIIAQGVVMVTSNLKSVQHPTGGVVTEIRVRDGDQVARGDVLFRLDAAQAASARALLEARWIPLVARQARLIAERDGAARLATPPVLVALGANALAAEAMAGERALFESRRQARAGQRAQLEERQAQMRKEHAAVQALSRARLDEAGLLARELKGVEALHQGGYVSLQKLIPMQRDMTRLRAEQLQFSADAERIAGRSSELEMEHHKRAAEHQTEVVNALREAQSEIAQLEERRGAAEEGFMRLEVRAPHAGVVLGSTLHTVGGVVEAGATVMRIVPQGEPLVVEVPISPRDIDQVRVGSRALVKLQAGNQRIATPLDGEVVRVAADLTRAHAQDAGHFITRISLDPGQVHRHAGVAAQPGMAAEVFIKTTDRTAANYLIQPVLDQLQRAMRER